MSTDLVRITELLDVASGEVLPATVTNAGRVLLAAREMKARINDVVAGATQFLQAEAAHQGTKTFHREGRTISLTGGPTVEYDAQDLMGLLMEAGCPAERINEAVTEEITYKVNRSVLRQLAAANPNYKTAIELAERTIEKPYRVSIR